MMVYGIPESAKYCSALLFQTYKFYRTMLKDCERFAVKLIFSVQEKRKQRKRNHQNVGIANAIQGVVYVCSSH